MISDDTYRAKLQQTIAAIKAWTGFVADVARVEEGELPGAWRLALTPRSTAPLDVPTKPRDAHSTIAAARHAMDPPDSATDPPASLSIPRRPRSPGAAAGRP